MCQCDAGTVSLLESEFKATLAKAADLDTWADWLQQVVNKVLPSVKEKSEFPKAARQFLLKWSFYRYENTSNHLFMYQDIDIACLFQFDGHPGFDTTISSLFWIFSFDQAALR